MWQIIGKTRLKRNNEKIYEMNKNKINDKRTSVSTIFN